MRDPGRIDSFVEELRALWQKDYNHQMRLGQLLMNLAHREGLTNAQLAGRLWVVEDDELLEKIRIVATEGWDALKEAEASGFPPPHAGGQPPRVP